MKKIYLCIMFMLLLTSCGKEPGSEVSFVLPDMDVNEELLKPVNEEPTTEATNEEPTTQEMTQEETTGEKVVNVPYREEIEQLIEKYNEAEQFFNGILPAGYSKSTIHGGGHDWSLRLKCPGYNTIAGMDTYWRQYFTERLYDEEYGAVRENAFFEYDGDLCMQGITGFPNRMIFESVSDWVETNEGIEACFDISKNRCAEFVNEEEHFDRVRVTFVREDDILKIEKILDLEKMPQ